MQNGNLIDGAIETVVVSFVQGFLFVVEICGEFISYYFGIRV